MGLVEKAGSRLFLGVQPTVKAFCHNKTLTFATIEIFLCFWQPLGLYAQNFLSDW